jgi:3-dehydroquinate synthase
MQNQKTVQLLDPSLHVGRGILSSSLQSFFSGRLSRRVAILTDPVVQALPFFLTIRTTINNLYGATETPVFVFEGSGEPSKTRGQKEKAEDWLLSKGFDRNTIIVAIGGGVVIIIIIIIIIFFLISSHYFTSLPTCLALLPLPFFAGLMLCRSLLLFLRWLMPLLAGKRGSTRATSRT